MGGIISDKLADKGNWSRARQLNARESLQLWLVGVNIVLELLQALTIVLNRIIIKRAGCRQSCSYSIC